MIAVRRLAPVATAALLACGADLLGPKAQCVATPLSPPASGGAYVARFLGGAYTADTVASLLIRVARAQFFEAVPVESASVSFVPRPPSTVSPDSARTDTLGQAQSTVTFVGDSGIVDVKALVSGTPVNGSPMALCIRRRV